MFIKLFLCSQNWRFRVVKLSLCSMLRLYKKSSCVKQLLIFLFFLLFCILYVNALGIDYIGEGYMGRGGLNILPLGMSVWGRLRPLFAVSLWLFHFRWPSRSLN